MASGPDWWMKSGSPVVGDADGNVTSGNLDTTLDALKDGGFTALHKHVIAEDTPVNAVASTLSTNLAGNNNDLVYTAKTKGAAGDAITIAYVDPGEETAEESVEVTGTDIVVTLRSVSSVLSTATQVTAAIEANEDADALVTVANKAANDGSGAVIAMSATALANGVDGTPGTKGELRFDTGFLYICSEDNTVSTGNWLTVAIATF